MLSLVLEGKGVCSMSQQQAWDLVSTSVQAFTFLFFMIFLVKMHQADT